MTYDYIYIWKKYGTQYTGRKCRILKRGKKNSVQVEFDNGEQVICSRYAIRKRGEK